MGANKKTVLKGFDYMHCDDFAKYLNEMAAKGWHFKEWGLGLVFEKGEPEESIYAVEVFTEASENDTRPEPHTQEFAEYCEAAGWKLIDAKQKFCIFKKNRESAVEILTPEERVANAYKATTSGSFILLLVLYGFNAVLQCFNMFGVMNAVSIFSNSGVFSFLAWNLLFLLQLCKFADALLRKGKLNKKIRAGENVYIGDRQNHGISFNVTTLFMILLVILLTGQLFMMDRVELVIINVIVIVSTLILASVIAKVRPESNTNFGIQIVFCIVLMLFIMISTIYVATTEEETFSQSDLPLQTIDYREGMGEIEDISIYQEKNIFGSSSIYFIFYENDSLIYYVYRSDYDWILDRIWEAEMEKKANETATDCTAEWAAKTAFRNRNGQYYVRYEDAILILREDAKIILTSDQIDIIRDKLDLR